MFCENRSPDWGFTNAASCRRHVPLLSDSVQHTKTEQFI